MGGCHSTTLWQLQGQKGFEVSLEVLEESDWEDESMPSNLTININNNMEAQHLLGCREIMQEMSERSVSLRKEHSIVFGETIAQFTRLD